ncbi:porin [Thaumasiovibrio subtropicus]|uniref:porin n=1 Tax=Thaumasiovibrio subtropicus TaxID=1891207 RepID=UPI00131D53D2|nr:porin [Thaumasiovibrio subtropicus]
MNTPFFKTSLLSLSMLGMPALANIALIDTDTTDIDLYGQAKTIVRYHSEPAANTDAWQWQDNSSRIGIRARYKLGDFANISQWRLRAQYEHGSKLHADESSDRFFTRQAWVGISNEYGRIYYGQQNSLYKQLEGYEFSHKLGGNAFNDREELSNKRPENTLYMRTQLGDVRLEGQYFLSRDLERRPRIRVGGHDVSLKETEVDYGYGIAARLKPITGMQLRAVYQTTEYALGGIATSTGTTLIYEEPKDKRWRIGTHIGHVGLENTTRQGSALGVGIAGRYALTDDWRAYTGADWLNGSDDIEQGSEFSWTAGSDYQVIDDLTVYAEYKQSQFDDLKKDAHEFAVGASYRF